MHIGSVVEVSTGTGIIGIRLVDFVGALASIVGVERVSALLWDGNDSSSNFTSRVTAA